MIAPALSAALAEIDAAQEAAYAALREANRAGLTGAALSDVLARFDAVRASVTEAQARWFGAQRYARHRLVVALGTASLVSPSGRSSRLLWTREEGAA